MDIIYLTDLEIETVIGIFDWERRIRLSHLGLMSVMLSPVLWPDLLFQ